MTWLATIAAYVVAAFLTYGYVHNDNRHLFPYDQGQRAFFAGTFWPVYWGSYPIYWAGHFAIKVTK